MYFLSHELTQEQIAQKVFLETTLPNIADRWKELLLPIHKDESLRHDVGRRIKEAFDSKWKAQEQIAFLRKEYGQLTT